MSRPAQPGDDDAALRELGRLKLRASLRKQGRKLRTPRGLLFAALGAGLFVLWIGGVVSWSGFTSDNANEARDVVPLLRLGGLVMFALSLFGALKHRGLYLPAEEIERLFSAPLSRAAITRYRLRALLARILFGGVLIGLMVTRRTPVPLFGFLGAVCSFAAIGIAGQTFSILAGGFERKLSVRGLQALSRAFFLAVLVIGVLLFWLTFLGSVGDGSTGAIVLDALRDYLPMGGRVEQLGERGVLRWLALPLEPWVQAMAAETWLEFATWFPLGLFLTYGLYGLTARLPIDYRELSLQTAASVAERLRRMRRVGGGASSSQASSRTRALRVPFFFGRSPAGALAWRKSVEILRKARGTLWVSVLVMLLLLFVSGLVADGTERGAVLPCIVLAGLGIVYLCSGLRFDFRDDLDRMATIRSWPLRPTSVFVATLLPEFVLVCVLIWMAIGMRVLISGEYEHGVWIVVAATPPAAFAWLALDNLVFLFAPVRFVPGQEGALQNAGRLVVLLFLRVAGVVVVVGATGASGAGAWMATDALGGSETLSWGVALGIGWAILVAVNVLLALLGGFSYSRFDVARDRG